MVAQHLIAPPPRVLIVDDVASERLLLEKILSKEGYEVDSCSSGEEALARLKKKGVSLILLDLYMQGIDGLATCSEIRKSYSREELPVVLITAEESGELVAKGLRVGANDYICKPFEREVLLARVENQLLLWRARQELKLAQSRLRIDMVGVLCSGIAHNMNNLFSALMGAVQLGQREQGESERLRFCFETMEKALGGGKELTDRLGFFQRVLPFSDKPIELLPIAESVKERLMHDCDLALNISLSELKSDIKVLGTEEELSELLFEIFKNAIEACADNSSVEIKLTTNKEDTAKSRMVTLCFKDNGKGMDEETVSRVCEPFFSTNNLDSRHGVSVSGKGLGMWKVYWIVHARAGTVSFDSKEGSGTEVFVTLPAA